MTLNPRLACSVLAAAGLLASAASAQLVQEGGRPFTVQMNGHNEVNAAGEFDKGDLDGSGTARLMLNYGQGRVCYEITVANIATPTMAHIHEAPINRPGPIVVPLFTTSGTSMKGCVDADPEEIKDIIQKPEDYYVNVHNADFPAGAIRGQMAK